jgi:hypothetical protein
MTLLAEQTYARAFAPRKPRQIVSRPRADENPTYSDNRTYKGLVRVASPAFSHAQAQVAVLNEATPQSKMAMLHLLHEVLAADSAFPTISGDGDDGIMAQWRARRSYVTIEINGPESSLAVSDLEGELVLNTATRGQLDNRVVRDAISHFSAALKAINPSWRNLFA